MSLMDIVTYQESVGRACLYVNFCDRSKMMSPEYFYVIACINSQTVTKALPLTLQIEFNRW